jgi:hypothetical protein
MLVHLFKSIPTFYEMCWFLFEKCYNIFLKILQHFVISEVGWWENNKWEV